VKPDKNLATFRLYITGEGFCTSLQKSANFGKISWRHISQGSVFIMTATTASNQAKQIPYTRRGSWLFRRSFPFCL